MRKTLSFEVPEFKDIKVALRQETKDEKRARIKKHKERRRDARDICVASWKKIIDEVRNSQIVINQDGIATRRHEPPVVLSMMK